MLNPTDLEVCYPPSSTTAEGKVTQMVLIDYNFLLGTPRGGYKGPLNEYVLTMSLSGNVYPSTDAVAAIALDAEGGLVLPVSFEDKDSVFVCRNSHPSVVEFAATNPNDAIESFPASTSAKLGEITGLTSQLFVGIWSGNLTARSVGQAILEVYLPFANTVNNHTVGQIYATVVVNVVL